MQKIIVILGQTATGKSDLAVRLAKEFNGEIISADSRQVYKGLDIGTGKISGEEMQGVPHHLLDIADPKERFTVSQWKEMAEHCIEEIASRSRLPIICGGTGFYISALIDGLEFPSLKTKPEEQKILEQRLAHELYEELKRLDPRRAAEIDPKNTRRLSRAILIARELGSVPVIQDAKESRYDSLLIGISMPDSELKIRIFTRLETRIRSGMIEEAERLHKNGLSYERMDELGLEYRYLAKLLQGELNMEQLKQILPIKIWQYARRQKTWFKKDKRIIWKSPAEWDQIQHDVRTFMA